MALTKEQNIRAILETSFAGFKEEIIESAVKRIIEVIESYEKSPIYGYPPTDLITFGKMCRMANITDFELKRVANEYENKGYCIREMLVTFGERNG